MDFGRPMIRTPGLVTKSNIRLVEETRLGNEPLDRQLCCAANEAAKDLFLGNDNPSARAPSPRKDDSRARGDDGDKNGDEAAGGSARENGNYGVPSSASSAARDDELHEKMALVDCSLYDERHLTPARRLIRPGDLVVVFESFNDLNFVYASPGATFSNRNGHFPHNDFIGKPYGCKIRSRNNGGLGFLYLLRPTPELWAQSLPHRTQIVHELDASMIVHYLGLCPNMVVCESGTGSGAMSHAIMRSIAPRGKLHTYEFNKMRVDKARNEFVGHGLGHLVEVHHRDVCGKRTLLQLKGGPNGAGKSDSLDSQAGDSYNGNGVNGKDDDGRGGFCLGQASVHAVFLDLPEPWLAVPHAAHVLQSDARICSYSPCMEQTQRTAGALRYNGFHSIRTVEARLKEFFVDEVEIEEPPSDLPTIPTEETLSLERERCVSGGLLPEQLDKVGDPEKDEALQDKIGGRTAAKKRKISKVVCARPFAQMRGHTAFLTFATAGNALRPDPNDTDCRAQHHT